MAGYLNLPEKTRQVLTDDGWYKTGDVFRCEDGGAYTFVGRTDDMFVCGGENIYPGEVESLLERHADIAQACVVPVPDDVKGEKPFAFVVLRAGATLTEDNVKQYMATAGIEIVGSTPPEFGAFFRHEKDLWAKVIRDTGAKIE